MDVMGVDACPGGWVGVVLRDGGFAAAHASPRLTDLLARVPEAKTVAVDIPLGLLEKGWRQADALARGRLGRQGSRVFPVPPGIVWAQSDYAAAAQVCMEHTGRGLNRQTWALAAKLREAAACREGDARLHEVHPEVCYARMAGGEPVAASKKSWNGQAARRSLLLAHGIELPGVLEGTAGRTPPDDVLDAAAAAWTAHRIAASTAGSLPDPPQVTASGLPIAIWY